MHRITGNIWRISKSARICSTPNSYDITIPETDWLKTIGIFPKESSKLYNELVDCYPEVLEAHQKLGTSIREAGPLDRKTLQLIQLAAAGATQSEGAVLSHTRRAIQASATEDEIYHTLLVLMSTIGFPKVIAAISWARDILNKK